ncbi:MAG TPA: low temperature requirement protein A [Actinocrinis sp.]|uniref:low temperature requirement protein A n=1 Tax=Actinocrinis sp. TaxID=1920516 RepID=UPI002DDDB589|nr:low temperature requirement protein A [Actinocrinis sp.]HEV2347826.1 low temperature requirement protein A [Actinocrinis sp.]
MSEVRHTERQPGADVRPKGGKVPLISPPSPPSTSISPPSPPTTTPTPPPTPALPPNSTVSHGQRVSWAELFFDLVFVFAVTQVAAAAQNSSSAVAVGRALVLFVPFWWAWVGVSILYNGVELVSARRHLKVFALGLGAFVMSIAVPDAYGQRGQVFAFAYLSIRLLLAWAIWRRGFFHDPLNPYTVSAAVSAPLIVVGSFAALNARGWIWLAAAVIELASPSLLRHRIDDLRFDSSHLPERFGLFVLIALGEVLVGVGVQESREGLSGIALTTLVLAFVFSCALWWTYFHFAAPALEHALREARVQSVLVRSVFSHGHLAMVTGLILIAAGLSQAVRTPLGHPNGVHAYFLAAGTALYVLTFCYTRARMFGGMGVARLVAGLVAAALAGLGPFAPAIATLAILVTLLLALNIFEAWWVASNRNLLVIRTGRGAIDA